VDGSLDTTFDGDGKVETDASFGLHNGLAIAIQSDGKILLGGALGSGSSEIALVRYNVDGSLDTTLDGDGIVTAAIRPNFYDYASVAIQSDGKILVGGGSRDIAVLDFVLLRYNVDGSLDTTFDGDGIVTTSTGTTDDYAAAMAIQSDGKILLGGPSGGNYEKDFALARYCP
jgi:uncharacterized delta-60 repeat protein